MNFKFTDTYQYRKTCKFKKLFRAGPFKWRCNLDALANNLDHLLNHAVAGEGKKCPWPTLFISGENSNYMTNEDSWQLKKIFPYSSFEAISGAGHW